MLIPKDDDEREILFNDVIMKCMVSRNERSGEYERMRNYYMMGTEDGKECPFNKINPHIDLLTAFLFASETTKFSISIGAAVPEEEHKKVGALSEAVMDEWLRGGVDKTFSEAVTWSSVYNSCFVKLIWEHGINPYIVEPQMIGVLREDLPYTDRQEALAHKYYITRSELNRKLAPHQNRELIMQRLSAVRREMEQEPSGVQRLVMSASSPNMIGVIEGMPQGTGYRPRVGEELIEMTELWVWDDEESDYLTVTMADPGIVIYDRKNVFLSGELPYVQVCPNPLYNYYWGASEVNKLTKLQDWRSRRMGQISDLLGRQLRPPRSLNGTFGILDENNFALDREGGILSFSDPMAKIEEFKPSMPQDVFSEIHEIDNMFNEASGLTSIMQGGGERGVRTSRQTSELARFGSARARKRALVIEDALEKIGTLCLKMIQKYDPRKLLDDGGQPFIAKQFTSDYVLKVDAHSSSPIFVEDQRDLAFSLFEVQAIDKETLIEMCSPPSVHLLKQRLKRMEEKEAQQQQAQVAAEAKSGEKGE